MASREYLRLWEQSTWPTDDFTIDANRADLVGLQLRHEQHRAFTYIVLDPSRTESLGCVYFFPTTVAFLAAATVTPVNELQWPEVDAFVNFWVRPERIRSGMDGRLVEALRGWFAGEWRFAHPVFDTSEQFTQQATLLEGSDLELRFRVDQAGKPSTRLAFG